ARAVDGEDVRVVHPCGLARLDPGRKPFEELADERHGWAPCRCGLEPIGYGTATSGSSRRRTPVGGRNTVSASATSGAAAETKSDVRRSIESAIAPRPTAATPPRPIAKPIARPEAMPMFRGKYCCAITIVTPNVPTIAAPTPASAIAPGMPPTSRKTS